jgi:hypothetical protein
MFAAKFVRLPVHSIHSALYGRKVGSIKDRLLILLMTFWYFYETEIFYKKTFKIFWTLLTRDKFGSQSKFM